MPFFADNRKRGYPMPTTLPPGLHSFLLNAPAVPFADGALPAPVAASPVAAAAPVAFPAVAPGPVHQVPAPVPVPMPVPVAQPTPELPAAQKISNAFDDMAPAPTSSSSSFALKKEDEHDLVAAADAMKNVAKKAIHAHEQSVESSSKTLSSLHNIKQKLATERISLEATVTNAIVANNETNAKLEATTEEIARLQNELRALREKLDQAMKQQAGSQVCILFCVLLLTLFLSNNLVYIRVNFLPLWLKRTS